MLEHAQDGIKRENKARMEGVLLGLKESGALCVPLSEMYRLHEYVPPDTEFYLYDDSNFTGVNKWYMQFDGKPVCLKNVKEVYNGKG